MLFTSVYCTSGVWVGIQRAGEKEQMKNIFRLSLWSSVLLEGMENRPEMKANIAAPFTQHTPLSYIITVEPL